MLKSQLVIDKTELIAENGLVTAMQPLAAEAGLEILQQGGNAADAAVATAFALAVVEPFMSGLGGAAYALAYEAASGRLMAIDGSAVLPRAAAPDMFELLDPLSQGGGYGWRATKGDASETGYRSVAVPGALATYSELLARFGKLPLSQIMAPAIRLAREGFVPDWYVFVQSALSRERLRRFPETMAIFYHSDSTPIPFPVSHDTSIAPRHERLVQSDLARTLELIARQGANVFYRGEIGQAIVDHLSAHHGILATSDLADYVVRVSQPLSIDYRGKQIALLPENSGAPTLAQMLNILSEFDLTASGYNTVSSLHLIAEAQRLAFADRFSYLGDRDFAPIPLEGLLSKAYSRAQSQKIDPVGGPARQVAVDPWRYQSGGKPDTAPSSGTGDAPGQHTTHLTVVDKDRNMVSMTSTLGRTFGSGVTVPGTGIVLNNGMMWFDPEPGRVNSIEPGKRALHAATPVLVFDERRPVMALGAPGGRKLITAVLQVLLNVIDFGMGIQAAISAPRVHCESGPVHMDVRLLAEVIEGLQQQGHEVALREETFVSFYFGRPNGILIDHDHGVLRGGVEPFKAGVAVGF